MGKGEAMKEWMEIAGLIALMAVGVVLFIALVVAVYALMFGALGAAIGALIGAAVWVAQAIIGLAQ